MPNISEATRAYIYRLAAVALVVGLAYGVIKQDEVDLWLQVVGTVIGLAPMALAVKNTSTNPATPKATAGPLVGTVNIVNRPDGVKVYQLEVDGDPEQIEQFDQVTFKVASPNP